MSTSAVMTDPNTPVNIPVKSELINFVVVKETATVTDADGVTSTKVTARHTSSVKEIEKLEKDSPDKIAIKQSVTAYKVGTVEGLAELVPDVEEQVAIINRGLMQKFNQKIKTVLTEVSDSGELVFEAVDGSYDSKSLLQEGTQRRNLSETDKALKVLGGLNADDMAKVLAFIQAQTVGQGA